MVLRFLTQLLSAGDQLKVLYNASADHCLHTVDGFPIGEHIYPSTCTASFLTNIVKQYFSKQVSLH